MAMIGSIDEVIRRLRTEMLFNIDGNFRWTDLNIGTPAEGALIVVRRSDGTVSSGYYQTDHHHWWRRSDDDKCGSVEWAYASD